MNIEQFKESKGKPKNICKGIFWRATNSTFLSSYKSIEGRKSLRLLKKISCKGCPECDWIWEYLFQDIANMPRSPSDYIGKIKDGSIYKLNIVSSQRYGDLCPENDYSEFIEVKINE